MILVVEGIAMCGILLTVCVIGIANGPVGLVVFYEPKVQARVVELGYATSIGIRKTTVIITLALVVPMLVLVPLMVYGINGAVGFRQGFWQMTVILWIMGVFDRLFIDWYWVGKTKAWVIPGTEDLQPYIPLKVMVRKWIGTVLGFPALAALMAGAVRILFG